MLNIDQIKKSHGPSQFEHNVPEWEGKVLSRRLTAPDYIALNSSRPAERSESESFEYMIDVVQMALINDDGTPLFDESTRQVLIESPLIVIRLGTEILAFNKLSGGDAEKNSESNPS